MREDSTNSGQSLVNTQEANRKPQENALSIVLPTYNEVDTVRPLAEEIRSVLIERPDSDFHPHEIIFVDDGSEDGTRDELETLAREYSEIVTIFLRRNFGQSAALAAGIDAATGEVVITMDADRQNDPHDIPDLVATLNDGYDCVNGWRKNRNDSLKKQVPSGIQTYLAQLTGPNIHDFGCTLKAYRSEALDDIDLYGEGHRYIPAQLYKQGYLITEQEVTHRSRTHGETKYGPKRLIKGFVDLLFVTFWNRYSTRPLHFLGGLGFMMMFVGLLIGSHAVVIKYVFGVALWPKTPRLILTIGLILFGFQLVMFGFVAEMFTKLYYRADRPYRIETIHGKSD